MPYRDTDTEWERLGATDPYFGVLTHEKYRTAHLTEATREQFFRSGEEHLAEVMSSVTRHLSRDFAPGRALDFGCGVGRVTIPLARVAREVVGVDVSTSMLREAERNCRSRSIDNVELVESGPFLARDDTFDFIHSFIVFQHLQTSRGERILGRLLARLKVGGVCAAHFTYANPGGRRIVSLVRTRVPLGNHLVELARRWLSRGIPIEMNAYDLNRLLSILQKGGVGRVHAEFTDHGGHLGVMLYFSRET